MNIDKFSKDMSIISKLADAPTGTASELKAKFDEGGLALKDYINNLVEVLNNVNIPDVVDRLDSTDTQAALSAAMGRALDQNKQNKIRFGTDAPGGGVEGDIYIQY